MICVRRRRRLPSWTGSVDTVDVGPLADSWRFEPNAAAYTRLYLADLATPDEQLLEALAAPVSAAKLRSVLDRAKRVRVADRTF